MKYDTQVLAQAAHSHEILYLEAIHKHKENTYRTEQCKTNLKVNRTWIEDRSGEVMHYPPVPEQTNQQQPPSHK